MTNDVKPVHQLRDALEAHRLEEIERLAKICLSAGGLPPDSFNALAHLQLALTAVREEISAHDVKLGGGSEKPLE
jgi:hypothetical protein